MTIFADKKVEKKKKYAILIYNITRIFLKMYLCTF